MKPQFTIESSEVTSSFGKFTIEPLAQGFGHTLGNSLRRVLYTSIPGAAITSVSINGASHQFTSISGVQEDIVKLVLALKQVNIKYTGNGPVQISLSAKGIGEVKASDFELPATVVIANPELVLAHITEKTAKLELTATVETGLGYSPADERELTTVGVIPVDATFTPVIRVNFSVESTRVGRMTNFDKLILEISTNGTVSPLTSLTSAAQILADHFLYLVSPQITSSTSGSAVRQPQANVPGSTTSVEELDLPTRIANAMQKAGFETVAQILATPRAELAKIKNLGAKSVKIIELALRDRGFELPA